MTYDSVKEGLMALVRQAMSRVDRFALYRAKLVKQSADLTKVDVVPDDPRVPGMSAIPLKHGLPGATVQVDVGAYLLVGWEGGNPARPYACIWEAGAGVPKITIKATLIQLGGDPLVAATDGVVLGSCPDPFTGATHFALGGASSVVLAKKVP